MTVLLWQWNQCRTRPTHLKPAVLKNHKQFKSVCLLRGFFVSVYVSALSLKLASHVVLTEFRVSEVSRGGKNPLIQETVFQENDKEVFVKPAQVRKFKETEYASTRLLCLYDLKHRKRHVYT